MLCVVYRYLTCCQLAPCSPGFVTDTRNTTPVKRKRNSVDVIESRYRRELSLFLSLVERASAFSTFAARMQVFVAFKFKFGDKFIERKNWRRPTFSLTLFVHRTLDASSRVYFLVDWRDSTQLNSTQLNCRLSSVKLRAVELRRYKSTFRLELMRN
jgi:hypothetical protein